MSTVIGVDPGLTGSLVVLRPDSQDIFDLPALHDPLLGLRRIDVTRLAELLQKAIQPGERVRVCIEALANGGFGKGRTNAATVGSQFWTQSAIVSTLELLGLQVDEFVAPVTWKKFYGLQGKSDNPAGTMRRARELVSDLYPDLADFVQHQKDHNRAEAVLIAHWFRKVRG